MVNKAYFIYTKLSDSIIIDRLKPEKAVQKIRHILDLGVRATRPQASR